MPERRPRLEGKVAVVTGAGSIAEGIGNGKATSVLFAREGARVLVVDIVEEAAMDTLRMIEEEGGEASVFVADVTSSDDCYAMCQAAVDRYGRLDILVNNVGISSRGDVLSLDVEEWDQVMDVNVKSVVLGSRGRHSPHDQDRRRRHHEPLVDRGAAGALAAGILRVQDGHHRPDADHGVGPRPGPHSRQRHRAGAGLHAADGDAHDGVAAGAAGRDGAAGHRGHGVGHRLCQPLPCQ